MRSHTTKDRIELLMQRLGTAVSTEGRIYFTGGVSAVLMGWREMTIDVDLKAEPEPQGFFECLPRLKDDLDINIELASPDQFVPALPGWQDRSGFIARHGKLSFYHYDFYGQALAKVERDHPRDRHDVACMIRDELVRPGRLQELFTEVESQLIRYPAVDAASLRERVLEIARDGVWNARVMTLDGLPGNDLIQQGLEDLVHRRASVAACLVKIASPRMRRCGMEMILSDDDALNADRELYALLGHEHGNEAHSRYNALLRELVSFERALEARHRRMRDG